MKREKKNFKDEVGAERGREINSEFVIKKLLNHCLVIVKRQENVFRVNMTTIIRAFEWLNE